MNEEILNQEETIEEPKIRQNPFCVISKKGNENGWHDLQTNSSWSNNPYGEDWAIVPDDMVQDIAETRGFCDIELNEDETEVVNFTPREIPDIPQEEPAPTTEERITILEECCTELLYQNALQDLGITESDL